MGHEHHKHRLHSLKVSLSVLFKLAWFGGGPVGCHLWRTPLSSCHVPPTHPASGCPPVTKALAQTGMWGFGRVSLTSFWVWRCTHHGDLGTRSTPISGGPTGHWEGWVRRRRSVDVVGLVSCLPLSPFCSNVGSTSLMGLFLPPSI